MSSICKLGTKEVALGIILSCRNTGNEELEVDLWEWDPPFLS